MKKNLRARDTGTLNYIEFRAIPAPYVVQGATRYFLVNYVIIGLEIKRKIVHLSTLVIPFGYALTSKETVLAFLLPFFLIYLAVDLLRHFHPGMVSLFSKYFYERVLREKEKSRLMGSTYFLFSSLLVILLFPKPIAIE